MKTNTLILTILAGIVAGVVSYWMNSYNEMYVFGVHIYIMLISSTVLVSFVLASFLNAKPHQVALFVSLGVIISVLCRIFFDLSNDASTHNLFPFEIIIALAIAIPSAFAGSYLPQLIRRPKSS